MKTKSVLNVILFINMLILISLLSSLLYIRKDMTACKTYTLSDYTISILQELDSNVEITWFKSAESELLIAGLQYLPDMMQEYVRLSKSMCIFTEKDTGNLTLEKIKQLGLIPRQIEKRTVEQSVTFSLYSGLMMEYKGITKIIPFIDNVSSLEYEITNFIMSTEEEAQGKKKELLVLAPEGSLEQTYMYVKSWLEYAGYTLKLPPFDSNSGQLPLLVLGSGYGGTQTAAFIDEFLQKNGKAVFFVSGNTVNTETDWAAKPKINDHVLDILAKQGLYITGSLVLDIANFRIKMNSLDNSGYKNINYPFWATILYENLDRTVPIFAGIKNLQTFWASPLVLDTDLNPSLKPLACTTEQAIIVTDNFDTDPFGNQLSLFAHKEKASRIIAASSNAGAKIIVVSDENMLSKTIEYTEATGNLDFMLNCLEWIAGKEDLLQLKSKTYTVLPFKHFESQKEFLSIIKKSRIIAFVILPSLIIIAGCIFKVCFLKRHK